MAGQQSPVHALLDLWQLVHTDSSSSSSSSEPPAAAAAAAAVDLVAVLRRLSLHDAADAVQQHILLADCDLRVTSE